MPQQSNCCPMTMNVFLANSNNEGQSARFMDANPLLFHQRNSSVSNGRKSMLKQAVGFASFQKDENAFAKKALLQSTRSIDEKISVKQGHRKDQSSAKSSAVMDESEKQFRTSPLSKETICMKEEDNQGKCSFVEENQPLDSFSDNISIFIDTSTSTNISFQNYWMKEKQTVNCSSASKKRSAKKSKENNFTTNASKVKCLKMINFSASENLSSKNLHASMKQDQLPWITTHTCKDVKVEKICNEEAKAKSGSWHQVFPNVSKSMEENNVLNKRKGVCVGQGSTCFTTKAANDLSSDGLQFADMDHDLVLRTKKRKVVRSELLPWHKRVTEGYASLQILSVSETDWVQAANKINKVEAEIEMKDGIQMDKPRRRLVLTTQLMHQLFPPTLELDATSTYDHVIYLVSKMVLGNACGLLSYTASLSEDKEATSQLMRDMTLVHFSKLLEDFDKRSRLLESEFLRLDENISVGELKLEWQELNGFSIVNRFGKFHGKKISDGTKTSTFANPFCGTSEIHVTALSVPVEHPDRTLCMQL